MPDASSRPGQDDLLQILLKKQMMETVAERTMRDTRRGEVGQCGVPWISSPNNFILISLSMVDGCL